MRLIYRFVRAELVGDKTLFLGVDKVKIIIILRNC